MADNNYNNEGYNYINYYNFYNYQLKSKKSNPSQPVSISLSDVQAFLNNFYFRLLNGEHKSVSQVLPTMNSILSEMKNIVFFISEMEEVSQHEELWWDESHQYVVYEDRDSDCSSDQESSYQGQNSNHSTSSSSYNDDSSNLSSDLDSNSTLTQLDVEIQTLEDEIFIDSLLNFMDVVAPKSIFNKKKSMRRKNKRTRKLITPHLRSMWTNSADIVDPVTSSSGTSLGLPVIDFSKVNKRFVENIPKPDLFPIHGCAQFPDQKKVNQYSPFGYESGYMTDHGIVALPNNLVVHGYVWSKEVGWILKAHFPKGERRFRDKFSTFRGKKRKKELR